MTTVTHPPFKATLIGFRKALLRKVHFCPKLAETKRKNIILDHMNCRICLGSSRYWLAKSGQKSPILPYFILQCNAMQCRLIAIVANLKHSCSFKQFVPKYKKMVTIRVFRMAYLVFRVLYVEFRIAYLLK